eukprot:284583-Hanusia_phi.AAC.1
MALNPDSVTRRRAIIRRRPGTARRGTPGIMAVPGGSGDGFPEAFSEAAAACRAGIGLARLGQCVIGHFAAESESFTSYGDNSLRERATVLLDDSVTVTQATRTVSPCGGTHSWQSSASLRLRRDTARGPAPPQGTPSVVTITVTGEGLGASAKCP